MDKKNAAGKTFVIALAGNANVGKSAIFNGLTGLHQHIGNWPGKTVERAEGTLHFGGRRIDVIDLPGIYSLSTYSLEEEVTREYILNEKPDVVVNVVDASVLERNLYFTLQLMELSRPMVIALNQVDAARKKGINVDAAKLSGALGVPVVPTVAVKGKGLAELLRVAVAAASSGKAPDHPSYGKEIEGAISRVGKKIGSVPSGISRRWLAMKLLEGDAVVSKMPLPRGAFSTARTVSKSIERLHSHSCPTALACEVYAKAASIAEQSQQKAGSGAALAGRLDDVLLHRLFGYPVMLSALLLIFFSVFLSGGGIAAAVEAAFAPVMAVLEPLSSGVGGALLLGVAEGILATLSVVIPYILPFYLILGILEGSGYLARIAFLMDGIMHRIGLHGKAFIPLIMGFGCNVSSCISCRVMETHRERMIAVFVTTLIPCAAVTTVVLGLVGRYVGMQWALLLYVIDLAIVFVLGRIAFKAFPGEPSGLIMEMPPLRAPHATTIAKQTWFRMEGFVKIAFPIIIASTVLVKLLDILGLVGVLSAFMSPVTVAWLGLPAVTGILLIFGVLRKELTIVMLAALLGTSNFALVMTPVQMLTFCLVVMLYIPCASTIAALVKETGWKKALYVTVFRIAFAIVVGGIFYRILMLLGV